MPLYLLKLSAFFSRKYLLAQDKHRNYYLGNFWAARCRHTISHYKQKISWSKKLIEVRQNKYLMEKPHNTNIIQS